MRKLSFNAALRNIEQLKLDVISVVEDIGLEIWLSDQAMLKLLLKQYFIMTQ